MEVKRQQHLCSVPDNVTSDVYTVNLTGNETPTISIDTVDGESWPMCVGGTIDLEASVSNAGQSAVISWKVDGADAGSGLTYEFSGSNGQKIKAVLNSSLECLTENDVESNEITSMVDICTSTNEAESIELSTYPNPVVDFLTVEAGDIARLVVTEVTGKLVSVTNVNSMVTKIDLSQLASGNYLLKVEYNSGSQEIIEIQKK